MWLFVTICSNSFLVFEGPNRFCSFFFFSQTHQDLQSSLLPIFLYFYFFMFASYCTLYPFAISVFTFSFSNSISSFTSSPPLHPQSHLISLQSVWLIYHCSEILKSLLPLKCANAHICNVNHCLLRMNFLQPCTVHRHSPHFSIAFCFVKFKNCPFLTNSALLGFCR